MLLRFEGGPCDGHEEESNATPERLILTPSAEDFLRAIDPGTLEAISQDFRSVYELSHVDRELGIAIYEPLC
jgi:hypothetical protein